MSATKPRLAEDVTVCDIDGEAVVYDPTGQQIHYLNYSAALMLDLCDGTATIRQMAEAVADVYEMQVDEVEKQVRKTVRDLRLRSLLEPTTKKGVQKLEELRAAQREVAQLDQRGRVRMQVPRSA